MANPIDLTTLAAVKLYLSLEPSDTSADPELEALITAASRFAMTFCSRTFIESTYTKNFNGTGGSFMMLGESPVTAVSSVSVDGVAVPASPSPREGGFVFDDETLYLRGCYRLTRGAQNVAVTFTAGYASNAIPQDLAQAIIELVALKFRRRTNIDVSSRGIAGETISYITADMSRPVRKVLDLYQRAYP